METALKGNQNKINSFDIKYQIRLKKKKQRILLIPEKESRKKFPILTRNRNWVKIGKGLISYWQTIIPELHGDPCGRQGRESREHHPYNPSSTCCIRSYGNQRATCIEQRISPWGEALAMVATCCPHHQDLQHPIKISTANKTLAQNPYK